MGGQHTRKKTKQILSSECIPANHRREKGTYLPLGKERFKQPLENILENARGIVSFELDRTAGKVGKMGKRERKLS